jgi:tetratricopeptide (TPR) repeat protein
MIDKASAIKTAQKFLSKGQIDKAIAEWQKVAASYPDGNTLNFLGDLYLKKKDRTSAIAEYHKAAKIYLDEGFSLKSLAIFKKILNVDPQDTRALIALGELNEEKNIATDAIKYYLASADALSKQNKRSEVLDVYNRILNLAPKNIQLKAKIADLFSREGFVPEAAREFTEIGKLYAEKEDYEKARSYLTKSAEIQPNRKEVFLELSSLYERMGDLDQAVGSIDTLLQRMGEDAALLTRKAHILVAKGSLDEARAILAAVVEAEPENTEAKREVAALHEKAGDREQAWQHYTSVVDVLMQGETPEDAIGILDAYRDFEPVENSKKLATLYRQSGETDKAIHELYGVHELHMEAGDKGSAREALQEALNIRPDDEDIRSRIESLEQEISGRAAPAEEPAGTAAGLATEEEPADLEEGEPVLSTPPQEEAPGQTPPFETAAPEEKPVEVALTEADVFIRYGLHNDARSLLEGLKGKHPESIELHEKLKTVYKETKDVEQAVTECLVLSALRKRLGEIGASKALLDEAHKLNPSDPRLAGRLAEAETPAPEAPSAEPMENYGEDLAEADFYIQQGFLSEAADIYRRLLEGLPGNAEIRAKLNDVEQKIQAGLGAEAPAGEAAVLAEPEVETVSSGDASVIDELEIPEFDPSDILNAEEPELESGVMEIFDEFKKGLSAEIEAEDSETHYNLGIAYKEMGLVDDSIKEFQTSQNDPNFFVQSSTMLGICYMQKGLYPLAIESFSSALMKADPNEETSWSLKYDLALAFEKNGDAKEAFKIFTDVYGWKADFRDVAERLNELKTKADTSSRVQAGPTSESASEASRPPKDKKDKKRRVSYI